MEDIATKFTDLDEIIKDINNFYKDGEIEGIYVFIKTEKETRTRAMGLSLIERLGLSQLIFEDEKRLWRKINERNSHSQNLH